MKQKILIGGGIFILAVTMTMLVIYYRLAMGFVGATIEAVEGIEQVKKEWQTDGVNPIDSIKHQIIELTEKMDTSQLDHETKKIPID